MLRLYCLSQVPYFFFSFGGTGVNTTPAIELKNVTKTFGSVVANKDVNMDVRRGEILAILGENGSGKTTLMNMIAGIYYPDEGEILIDGEPVVIKNPKDAFSHGIGMIHQHFKLVDLFTATENIILGIKEKAYDLKAVADEIGELCERYGFELDPSKKIYDMSVSEKQTVEIIKVLYRGADILILDEPTAVLTPQEIVKLFDVLRKMRDDGKSIIIITHKMQEVLSLSNRVAILRKGEHIATVETASTDENQLTELMMGEKITLDIHRSEPCNVADRLVVENISATDQYGVSVLENISFTARAGEILGIAGIAGSGQRELLEAIAGLKSIDEGRIIFHRPKKDLPVSFYHKTLSEVMKMAAEGKFHYADGTPVDFTGMRPSQIRALVNEGKVLFNENEIMNLCDKTPLEIRNLGVRLSFVPEDRLGMGLVGNMDIVDNMMLRSYRRGKALFVDRKTPRDLALKVIDDLHVYTPNENVPVRRLSGGNIQKVLVGREIASAPTVLMAAYPVRGLDINSSYLIYNLLNEQKEKGAAVIFVGEDLDVLLALSDRILVIGSGHVTGIVDARTATKEEVGLLMTKSSHSDRKEEGYEG